LRLANNNPADAADNRFHGLLYRASIRPGQEVSRTPASYVAILDYSSLFCHDCAYLERPDVWGIKALRTCTLKPVSAGTIRNAVLVENTTDEALPLRESI
jgi:hypothetical protein